MTVSSQLRHVHGTIVVNPSTQRDAMIEPLLCGIVLGLIPITLLGCLSRRGISIAAAVLLGGENQQAAGSVMTSVDLSPN